MDTQQATQTQSHALRQGTVMLAMQWVLLPGRTQNKAWKFTGLLFFPWQLSSLAIMPGTVGAGN